MPSHAMPREIDLVVNARVACDPNQLGDHVSSTIRVVSAKYGADAEFGAAQMFRPGRPQPTHRMSAPDSV